MRAGRLIRRCYGILKWVQIVVAFCIVIIAASLKADPSKVGWEDLRAVLMAVQASAWWALPVATLIAGVLSFLKSQLGPPWVWNTIQHFLDVFRGEVFEDTIGEPVHHHRVTLFRRTGWRWARVHWPWDGWLVAVARSGHTTQNNHPVFRAPDGADRAEGVAGQAWAQRKIVVVRNLPKLDASSPREDFERYAHDSFVTVEWLQRHLPSARALCGIPVDVNGKPWGVIVLDSRDPASINMRGKKRAHFLQFARYLSKLLERV